MKILFFARRFWPGIGGVEKHILEVSKELTKEGNKVTVVTEMVGGFKGFEEKEKIKIYRIPIKAGGKLKKFQIWGWLWKNRKLIEEADIVHCHDVFFWHLPFKFIFPRKKVFTTFHGWEGKYPPSFKAILVRKISENLSNGNICVGDFIPKWYGTKADLVTYGAAKEFRIKNLELRIKKNYNIVFIGRLEKDTGLPIYLKALEILGREGFGGFWGTKDRIIFAGDGSLRKKAEKYGKVLGFVGDLGEYIGNSRYIFTSGYLSILEALINKKLVFCVYDNLLKKDYLLLAPFAKSVIIEEEPRNLAEKIKYFLNNPKEEEKLVKEGYEFARKQSWEKLTNEYLSLWRI